MRRFREAEWLELYVFNAWSEACDGEDYFFTSIGSITCAIIIFFITGSMLDSLWLSTPLAILVGLIVGTVMVLGITNLGALSVRRNVPSRLAHMTNDYLALTPEERKAYPRNFLQLVKNPHLTYEQQNNLIDSSVSLHREIMRKRKATAVLTARNIDIAGALEHMERAREGVKVEADTYEEYNV